MQLFSFKQFRLLKFTNVNTKSKRIIDSNIFTWILGKIKKSERQTEIIMEKNQQQMEINGPIGPEPTRYGDWELKGRAIDF